MRTKERLYLLTFLFSFCTFLISPSVLVLLEEDTDIAYFFNAAEEEENKEEGKEKDMDENFMLHFCDLEWTHISSDSQVFYHLQKGGKDVFFTPVIPPPESQA